MKERIAAALTAATLVIGLTASAIAVETPSIQASNYKSNPLGVREHSGLMIGPSNAEYTVTFSSLDAITVGQS